jgi:hypothetical protein
MAVTLVVMAQQALNTPNTNTDADADADADDLHNKGRIYIHARRLTKWLDSQYPKSSMSPDTHPTVALHKTQQIFWLK